MRATTLFRHLLVALLAALAIAGCGFQLRGSISLPFESIYIGGGDYAVIPAGLRRAIRGSGSTQLAEKQDGAQATFLPTLDARDTIILSYSSSGRVREKRLRYRYGYRIVDAKGGDLVLPGMVELSRDLTYADSDVLAKTQEEDLLWHDMESDLVQQLLRRLAAAKPKPPEQD